MTFGSRILLVDDSLLSRKIASAALVGGGFDVVEAETGEQALDVALSERLDLILLDLGLPGISGYEVARYLRTVPDMQHIPIIAVTGDDTQEAFEEAHLAGCRFYLDNCAATITGPFDVVLASCGGYPRDMNFIQCHKAMEYGFSAVKQGGSLVIAGECADGFGSEDFLRWFRFKEVKKLYEALRKNYRVYGQTAYATLWKAKKVDIVLVSSIDPGSIREMSITPSGSLEEAAGLVQAKYGQSFTACIMPFAADTLIKDESIRIE